MRMLEKAYAASGVGHTSQSVFVDNIIWKTVFSIGSFLLTLFFGDGTLNTYMGVVFLLFVLDFATWAWKGIHKQEFSSRALRYGAGKFVYYITIITVARGVDHIWWDVPIFTVAVLSFLILSDGISVLENYHELWYNVPVWLIKSLRMKKKELENRFIKDIDDQLDEYIWTKDQDDYFIRANKIVCRQIFNKPDYLHIQGKKHSELEAPFGSTCEDSDKTTKQNFFEKQKKKSRFIEWWNIWTRELWLDVHKQVLIDKNSWEITWTTWTARDITDIMSDKEKAYFRVAQTTEVEMNYQIK